MNAKTMQTISFNCGCIFHILKYFDNEVFPLIDFQLENINLNCNDTWDLICSGNTKGVFQLEKHHGQNWSRKIKPRNIEQLAILISLLRPGCLESGMTDKYFKIISNNEEESYLHEGLQPILSDTRSVLVYQEQSLEIAKRLAGFSLEEADSLRKSMGKKDAELMSKVEKHFIEKAKLVNILNESQAQEIFNWIKESQRYSFNKSHAIAYAYQAYMTAYAKQHFPLQFFCAYLRFAADRLKPMEEVRELVNNAKSFGIEVCVPSILSNQIDFYIENDKIYFSIENIKGVGSAVIKKLNNLIYQAEKELKKPLKEFTWFEFLILCLSQIKIDSATFLIKSGALSHFKIYRKQMMYELHKYQLLTEKEQLFIRQNLHNYQSLYAVLPEIPTTAIRKKKINDIVHQLKQPSFKLEDNIFDLVRGEILTLGVPISYNSVEGRTKHLPTHTCADINNKMSGYLCVSICIDKIKVVKTKNGKNPGQEMCFIEGSDATSISQFVVFPEAYKKYGEMIIENNTLMITGHVNGSSMIVKEIFQT